MSLSKTNHKYIQIRHGKNSGSIQLQKEAHNTHKDHEFHETLSLPSGSTYDCGIPQDVPHVFTRHLLQVATSPARLRTARTNHRKSARSVKVSCAPA